MSQGKANQRVPGAGETVRETLGETLGEASGETGSATSAAPVDRDHLDRHTFGNPDLAREVLGLFVRQAEQLGARLVEQAPAADLAKVVHTLKGSARGVGAWRVAGEAESVEAVLRTGQAADLSGLKDALGEARDFIGMLLDAE